jgi:hypothetical protein
MGRNLLVLRGQISLSIRLVDLGAILAVIAAFSDFLDNRHLHHQKRWGY